MKKYIIPILTITSFILTSCSTGNTYADPYLTLNLLVKIEKDSGGSEKTYTAECYELTAENKSAPKSELEVRPGMDNRSKAEFDMLAGKCIDSLFIKGLIDKTDKQSVKYWNPDTGEIYNK